MKIEQVDLQALAADAEQPVGERIAAGEEVEDEDGQWVSLQSILKIIPRDDRHDPFKPNSLGSIHRLACKGRRAKDRLTVEEEKLLQAYGAYLDLCLPLDRNDPPGPSLSHISRESRAELEKLPTWLQAFVVDRFDTIHTRYGRHTHTFLRLLASRMEYARMKTWTLLSKNIEETIDFVKHAENHDAETEALIDAHLIEAVHNKNSTVSGIVLRMDPFHPPEEFLVDKRALDDEDAWNPLFLQRAADALRAVLLAGASDDEEEGMDRVADEQWPEAELREKEAEKRRKRRQRFLPKVGDEEYRWLGRDWVEIVTERENFKEKGQWQAELEFTPKHKRKEFFMKTLVPSNPKEIEKKIQMIKTRKKQKGAKGFGDERLADEMAKRQHKESIADDDDDRQGGCCGLRRYFGVSSRKFYSYNVGHPLYRKPTAAAKRKARLFKERGVGKRPSRIYYKDHCKGPVTQVIKEEHQGRKYEGFHAYVNSIVESDWFNRAVMGIILLNAMFLALESDDTKENYTELFDVLDSGFLSLYLGEFAVKCYANPVHYFHSGFNVFDFIILLTSMFKAITAWTDRDSTSLKWLNQVFVIVRAMRILRGVSMSIHIQVLVSALIETLRKHVLSVVFLLVLLMYIASIVAYYFFSKIPGLEEHWGEVPHGMLKLFAFVTMDGWTDIAEEFEIADFVWGGRLFCIMCIVFGNFMFYNIFIAIIIMQISEATDNFRLSQADRKESKVFIKQEAVFKRQKLDMRTLLARQKSGISDDFFELGSKFVRRLRHDDLTDERKILTSPLWIDAFYKGMMRTHHTSNVLMNMHRKMSDRLVDLKNLYSEGKYETRGISRARYNTYVETKAQLRVLKQMFIDLRKENEGLSHKDTGVRVRLPSINPLNIVKKIDDPPTPSQSSHNQPFSSAPKPTQGEEKTILGPK